MVRRSLIKVLACAFLALGLSGLNIFYSIQTVALNINFFREKWVEYGVIYDTKMSLSDLLKAGEGLIGYFTGSLASPQVQVTIDGTTRMLYNETELLHLLDVKNLFQLGLTAKALSWGLFFCGLALLVLFILISRSRHLKPNAGSLLSKVLYASGAIPLATVAILAIPAATDFTSWWVSFHVMTFSNNLWQLDPSRDWLIEIFPEKFFFSAVTKIALNIVSFSIVYIVSAFFIGYFSSHYRH